MKEKKEHIDKIFQDGLNHYEEQPPEMIWESVQNHIAAGKKKSILPLYYKWAAGIALFIASSASIYFLFRTDYPLQLADQKNVEIETTKPHNISPESSQTSLPELAENTAEPPEQKSSLYDSEPTLLNLPTSKITPETFPENNRDIVSFEGQDYLAFKQPELETEKYHALQPVDFPSVSEVEKNQKSNFFVGWEAGMNIMPNYSYRTINSSQNYASAVAYLNQSEYGKASYSAELYLRKNISEKFILRSGLKFVNIGFKTGNIAFIEGLDNFSDLSASTIMSLSPFINLNNSAGTILSRSEKVILNQNNLISQSSLSTSYPALSLESDTEAKLIQNIYYLGVPFDALLRAGTKKYFYLKLGIQIDFLLGNQVYLKSPNGNRDYIGNISDLNKINFSTSVGFGFEYPLNHKMRLTIEPVFNYFLSPINKNHFISAHPYSFGIAMGVNLPL
jgi:hypothetical protein